MRCVRDNILYDTKKMGLLFQVETSVKNETLSLIYGTEMVNTFKALIYVSKNGRFCVVWEFSGRYCLKPIGEPEVKELMKNYNYDLYALLYGELEEA